MCILSLGSNLGDRRRHLLNGVSTLHSTRVVRVESISRVVESEPWGPIPQGPYLNLLVRCHVEVDADRLLQLLQRIEEQEGRIRGVRYGPRTLDIDIVFFGDLVLDTPSLTLPHSHWRDRPFVHDLLGDVIPVDHQGLASVPGVQDALNTGDFLSPELREVESITLADIHSAEKDNL